MSVDLHYECLWWSTAQMVGLDPNHPPAKTTRVALRTWEYGDPIGTPHPDRVDLVIQAQGGAGAHAVAVKTRWRVGTRWTAWKPQEVRRITIEAGRPAALEVWIPVEPDIDRLAPSRLQAQVLVDGRQAARADLPIQLGD